MNVDLATNGQAILRLEGELTIDRAAEMRTALLAAFEMAGHVILDFERVESVDLACLQLICSAHRTALKRGAELDVTPGSVGLLKKVGFVSGFQRDSGCVQDCVWSRVKKAA